jgi:hypothetical protein
VDGLTHKSRLLRTQFSQTRLDLIRTDLDTCLAFASIAETEYSMGHREHAAQTLGKAEKGYSDMLRFFSQAEATGISPETTEELKSKFKQVRDRLDGLASTNPEKENI